MAEQKVDYCAEEAARHGIKRSDEWPRVEKEHLQLEPHCAACKPGTNTGAGLQVHHKFPFHYCIALGRPDLELDQRNLISLCEDEAGRPAEDHHLLVGHLDNFKSSNLVVDADARTAFYGMTADEIKKDPRWIAKKGDRLKLLDEMSQDEKDAFTKLMNTTFPKKG